MTILQQFWRDTRAATSIEYAVISALASILIFGGAATIGLKLKDKMAPVADGLS